MDGFASPNQTQEAPVSRPPRLAAFTSIALAIVFLVAGCAGAETAADPVRQVAAADAVAMLDDRVIVDVRTPAEFAAGHVAGALNIDVEAADFDARISELEKDDDYLVYCRSGRRSALAAERMAAAGFSDIVDAGGLEPLADAGALIE